MSRVAFAALVLFAIGACKGQIGGNEDNPDGGVDPPDYGGVACGETGAAITFFETTCAGCHQGTRFPDLTRAGVAQLSSLESRRVPGQKLVVPGDPAASFLYRKMAHTQGDEGGAGMPLGHADPVPELSMIESWIRNGASTDCNDLPPPTVVYDPNTLDPAVLFTCADPKAPRSSPSRLRRVTDTEFTRVTVDAPGIALNPLAPPSGLPFSTYSAGVGMDAATLRLLMMQLPVASEIWSAGDPVSGGGAGRMRGISSCCVDRSDVVSCMEDASPADTCIDHYVDTLLRRGSLFRAPTTDESKRLRAQLVARLGAEASSGISRHDTLSEIAQTALIMTGSIFRSDVGDPATTMGTRRRLSNTELAYALGNILTDAPVGVPIPNDYESPDDPDAANLAGGRMGLIAAAAADGTIQDPTVRRSLFRKYSHGTSPDRPDLYTGARDTRGDYWIAPRLSAFFREWLKYGPAGTAFKDHPGQTSAFEDDGGQYSKTVTGWEALQSPPQDSGRHEATLVQQLDDLIARVVVESDASKSDVFVSLFTTRQAFLAAQPSEYDPPSTLWAYGFDEVLKPDDSARWVTYPAGNPRTGVLMHPAWLAAHGGNFEDDASLVHRGRWLRTELFCQHFGELSDVQGLQAMLGPSSTMYSARMRVRRATEPGVDTKADVETIKKCWACHENMNTLGYPFEQFNHAGFERSKDHGGAPDGSTTITNLPDPTLNRSYANAGEFVDAIAHSKYARRGMIRHAFRFFMGRDETLADGCTLVEMEAALDKDGSFFSMLEALVVSDTFVYRDLSAGGGM